MYLLYYSEIKRNTEAERKEDILEEARNLAENGVKKLIVILQDTTKYGMDLYGKKILGICF